MRISDWSSDVCSSDLALVVYRLGTHIPVPGINPDALAEMFQQNQGGILGLFNMFSGGALERFSVFALGIMPYISAFIFMQLMAVVQPTIVAIKKEGASGRRNNTLSTRDRKRLVAAKWVDRR